MRVLTVVTVAAAMHIGLRNSSDIQRYPAREAARRTWQDLIVPCFGR